MDKHQGTTVDTEAAIDRHLDVSVITPCYNSARFVARCIESIRAQTLAGWEHIVVDDGSTDGSAAVVDALLPDDPRLKLVRKPNGGVSSARNAGFQAASPNSKYLLFLDADDMLEPQMLSILADHLDARPEVGLTYCAPVFIDDNDCIIDMPKEKMGWTGRYVAAGLGVRELDRKQLETPFAAIFAATTIIPSISLIRRLVYERTPGWDESFGHVFEDTDLFLQIALRSTVHYLDCPLVRYRRHSGQSTSSAERVFAQTQRLYAKWADPKGLTAGQRLVVSAAAHFREGRLIPYLGLKAGSRHLRNGEIGTALRFYGGAIRRFSVSLLPAVHKRPGVSGSTNTPTAASDVVRK